MAAPAATGLSDVQASESLIQRTVFANPRLKPIIAAARIKTTHSWAQSVVLEVLAWLAIPIVAPVFIPILLVGGLVPIPFFGLFWIFVAYGATVHIIASVFYRLRRLAQRYRVNALADLQKDGRDPVLYLRSFYVDTSKDDQRLDLKTDEEVLTLALREIGPVLAVGSPIRSQGAERRDDSADERPLLGATRIYFADEDWQKAVGELMEVSRLVVINAGISDGLLWEMQAAVRKAGPSKLLISFLPWQNMRGRVRHARYCVFRERAERIFREALRDSGEADPARTENFNLPERLGDASFFFFSEDWKVEPVGTDRLKKRFYFMSLPTLMRETLRPALRKRGAEPKKLKSNIYLFLAIYMVAAPFIGFAVLPSLMLLQTEASTAQWLLLLASYLFSMSGTLLALFVIGLAIRNRLASWLRRRREVTVFEFLPEDLPG
jgi:hypothetical protein